MSFSMQAFRADLQFERSHNMDCDNGVYREEANLDDQAKRTGLKSADEEQWKGMMN